MAQTIHDTITQLHGALKDYIEATYHITDAPLIEQRRRLLDQAGAIFQIPYLESTPRYQVGERFSEMHGLPEAALQAYLALSKPSGELPAVLYDPPYDHQSKAIRDCLIDGKNLLIMTGTGSGKTESFLLPILGKLAQEAKTAPDRFGEQTAVRALLLYPMNALVNDQLGRLRSLFGDPRIVALFKTWAGRPPRFARYTSRTPYAGVRERKKDSRNLKAFEDFYVEIQRRVQGEPSDEQREAQHLMSQLKAKGKWPSKPDLVAWYGKKNAEWQDRKTKEFLRAVCLPDDTELLTRHEVQQAPPDLLVTNYSMLEYMLMRPIERPIFDKTRDWLAANPDEKFLVVLDEAHLYRGAGGAEVGLLLRRLRDRLGIPPDRFQIICATASFEDKDYAPHFGAQLSGVPATSFEPVTGNLQLRSPAGPATLKDDQVLASIDLDRYHEATEPAARSAIIKPLLDYRGVTPSGDLDRDLYHAFETFPPLGLLVNLTMKKAIALEELGDRISLSNTALTALMTLASTAKIDPKGPGLLPCRIHNFFRGLPGLWVCMDPDCTELGAAEKSGICGKMYGQPHEAGCACGARVLEFYTCRFCGTAYARAYTDNVDSPTALWTEAGRRLRMQEGETSSLLPLDLLLGTPKFEQKAEKADYDLETGRLNPNQLGPRTRTVFIRRDRITPATDDEGKIDRSMETRGQFAPCACCGKTAKFGRSYVQDHQTKGDQPFQALVAKQVQVQPPNMAKSSRFAPLRGRKVLVFSDSRQVAARLAPNLQMYSTRDSLRPLIVWGYRKLQAAAIVTPRLSLDDLYLAVLLGSKQLGVRLRPGLKTVENFEAEGAVEAAIQSGEAETDAGLLDLLLALRSESPPQALLDDIATTVQDPFLGLEALALASIGERGNRAAALTKLPSIPAIAETPETKLELVRAWLRCWRNHGFWLDKMPDAWWHTNVRGKKGKGKWEAMDEVLTDKAARKIFNDSWTPALLAMFTTDMGGEWRLKGSELTLIFDGEWVRCPSCKSVHRPVRTIPHCLDCGSHEVSALDPSRDPVFLARKGYYRNPVTAALAIPPQEPMALIAAEHTAQLNSPQNEDVFSKAELNELLFQDIAPAWGQKALRESAIDVLSSTTTMEVGIDIGALSGVALRNMPPGRANYQQRAGRAGRRGNAVATVVAFGSADSHDEHYFSEPGAMIAGKVVDPKLTLDNKEITKRHIRAFLLQNYHQDRIRVVDPSKPHDLFSVLGSVAGFRYGKSELNIHDFGHWLSEHEAELKARAESWIPIELSQTDRHELLEGMVEDCLAAISDAIKPGPGETDTETPDDDEDAEDSPEEGEERPKLKETSGSLLDRLLYRGVLPRYAFPTDVATFHVFDTGRSTRYRPIMHFAPSQGLAIALSQYAPGKQIWISGKCYTSGAIYSPMANERFEAWNSKRQLYRECSVCEFAETVPLGTADIGSVIDCPACGSSGTFGETRPWLRPPGFSHPIDVDEATSPDDMPETSYATRAKLTMSFPPDAGKWIKVNDRVQVLRERKHLLVSNTGPKKDGYSYCTKCGRIEASSDPTPTLFAPHLKPYPDEKDQKCPGAGTAAHIVLGTDFITDIALYSLSVAPPVLLKPGYYSTDVALRTLSEALAKAACQSLGIEPSELMAEYRPALTNNDDGRQGLKAEIFLYDTLSGGAGFASQLAEKGLDPFIRALELMKNCPASCDASCYRCLRSFKNKFEHSLLDRHVGAELLEYLLTGELPVFDPARLEKSTLLLFADLKRQLDRSIKLHANVQLAGATGAPITVPILATRADGKRFAIGLSAPLTIAHPADDRLLDLGGNLTLILKNELLVRGNLPAATREIQQEITA